MLTIQEIENYRVAHKLTKKQLAKQLSVSYSFFVDVLNGNKPLTANTILKFKALTGASLDKPSYNDVIAVPVRLTMAEWMVVSRKFGVDDFSKIEPIIRDYLIDQAHKELEKRASHP